MLADYHVHTAFSNDSVYPMEDVVKDAISLGMEDICFTDHVDYGPYRDWDDPRGIEYRAGEEGEPEWVALTNVEYKKYFSLIEELKEKYKEQISIKTGLECRHIPFQNMRSYLQVIHLILLSYPSIR